MNKAGIGGRVEGKIIIYTASLVYSVGGSEIPNFVEKGRGSGDKRTT